MGRCEYVLAKDVENFEVLQKNVVCGHGVTCANSVTVTVKGIKIHVARGGQVTVFGISANLPYTNRGTVGDSIYQRSVLRRRCSEKIEI